MDHDEAAAAAREEGAPVRNNSQGWVMATFIVLLALVLTFTAHWIHEKTFRSPTDPTAPVNTLEHTPHA
jgi:hypothetical protein